jgi:ribosome-associated protein
LKKNILTLETVGSELRSAIEASLDKKAADVVVLDLRGLASFTDFFLLCTGRSNRQLKTISDGIEDALTKNRVKPDHIEGYPRGDWLLMDYVDFVVHIFTARSRRHYDLERLWGDAGRLEVEGREAKDGYETAKGP